MRFRNAKQQLMTNDEHTFSKRWAAEFGLQHRTLVVVAMSFAFSSPAFAETYTAEPLSSGFGNVYPPFSWDYTYVSEGVQFCNWFGSESSLYRFPDSAGDIAQIYDYGVTGIGNYANNSGELQTVTNTSITIGGLELSVDNSTLYYDITVDHPSTQYYLFDNSPNNANAYIKMGAVNGASDIGKTRIDAPLRLNSTLDISGINLRLTGGIGGTGGINSNLSGTLYLYDDSTNSVPNNTFTGGVNINSGNVAINADFELGPSTSTLTFNGGTLTPSTSITSSRPINLTGTGTIYSVNGSTISESGVISGSGQLTLAGGGTFQLGTANTYTGSTVLQGGSASSGMTLLIGSANSLGNGFSALTWSEQADGFVPVLEINSSFATSRSIQLNNNGTIKVDSGQTLTVNGEIDGTALLNVIGTGTLVLGDILNGYSGGTSLFSGTLSVSASGQLGKGTLTFSNGSLLATGNATISTPIVDSSTALISVNSGDTLTLTGQISGTGITKSGAGTLALSNSSNNYSGQTLLQSGTLSATSSSSLGASGTPVVFAGGAFEASGPITTSRAFTGSGANPITLTADSGASLTLNGIVGGSGNASALTASGLGTVYLTNAGNNYTGGTTINGTLSATADGDFGTSGTSITFGTSVANRVVVAGNLISGGTFTSARPVILGSKGGQISPAVGTTLTLTTPVSGPSGVQLFVAGAGTLNLQAPATFTGDTSITSGTLQLSQVSGAALPTPAMFYSFNNAGDNASSVANSGSLGNRPGQLVSAAEVPASSSDPGAPVGANVLKLNSSAGEILMTAGAVSLAGASWTASIWVDQLYPNTNYRTVFHSNVTSGSGSDAVATIQSGNYTLGSYITNNGGFVSSGYSVQSLTGWHMLTAVGSGGASTSFYIDGNYVSAIAAESVSNIYSIGNYFGSDNQAVATYIGDVGIYQTALSASQVAALYAVEHGDGGLLLSSNVTVGAGSALNVNVNAGLASSVALASNGTTTFAANSLTGLLIRTLGSISIGPGGSVIVNPAPTSSNRTLLTTGNLTLSGTINSWTGLVDLANNDMVVHNGNLSNVTNQLKQGFNNGVWNGAGGIVSSTAAGDTTHLTAIGVAQNTSGVNALYSTFDGQSVTTSDVLLKYTYCGDANLDGKVDGSDYSRIDSGYLTHATGWFNGDFNYDGVVNGSDYTLIDNAFNRQTASLATAIDAPTAIITSQIASSAAVPEPTTLSLISIGTIACLRRRRRITAAP